MLGLWDGWNPGGREIWCKNMESLELQVSHGARLRGRESGHVSFFGD